MNNQNESPNRRDYDLSDALQQRIQQYQNERRGSRLSYNRPHSVSRARQSVVHNLEVARETLDLAVERRDEMKSHADFLGRELRKLVRKEQHTGDKWGAINTEMDTLVEERRVVLKDLEKFEDLVCKCKKRIATYDDDIKYLEVKSDATEKEQQALKSKIEERESQLNVQRVDLQVANEEVEQAQAQVVEFEASVEAARIQAINWQNADMEGIQDLIKYKLDIPAEVPLTIQSIGLKNLLQLIALWQNMDQSGFALNPLCPAHLRHTHRRSNLLVFNRGHWKPDGNGKWNKDDLVRMISQASSCLDVQGTDE